MTRLFGCVCNQPKRVPEALAPVRSALVTPGPVPRWGLGYVQAGQVLLSRNPRGESAGVDFASHIDALASDYIIGWAGGDDGLSGSANTPPFRYRSWLFAQTGTQAMEDPQVLAGHLPGYLQRAIRGKTTAEHHFHLFLAMLHDAGKLDDPDVDAHTIRLALRDSAALMAKVAGIEAVALGNFVACNSRSMVLARYGEQPVFVRSLRSEDPRLTENNRYRAVVAISCDDKPGDGFEAIPLGSAVVIHRSVVAEIRSMNDGEPRSS